MRILQVIAPARTGGAETVVLQLAQGLREYGHNAQVVVVLAPDDRPSHPFIEALHESGIPVHVVAVTARSYLRERKEISRLIRWLDADIMHTHGYRVDVVDGGVARSHGIAHVMTLHGFIGGTRRGRFYEWCQVKTALRADCVICVSEPIAERVRGAGVERRVLLPNSVSPESHVFSRLESRRLLEVASSDYVVGWVGRLGYEKGPDLFVEAVARMTPDVSAVMIGEGEMLDVVRERCRQLGIENRVRIAGALPRASRYFSAFDALALTSRTEGTPMVLLEAAHQRVPVIATAVGGVPTLLPDDCAYVVAPGDAGSIAAAMIQVRQAPEEAARKADRALQRMQKHFSIDAWLQSHEEIYRAALARSSKRRT